jgi:triacylglycerol lipase
VTENQAALSRRGGWPFWTGRPSLALEQLAAFELSELLTSPTYYGLGVPYGDDRPVLLIPGFLGSDSYLTLLSGWLQRVGYQPRRSGIGVNAGSLPALLSRVLARAEALAEEERRITIVGHSLGGVFARVVAVSRPDLVERVITLGSPLTGHPRDSAHPLVRSLGEVLMARSGDAEERAMALLRSPLPDGVHLTSIYTRRDAVVDWHSCIDADPQAENLEVRGSHVGLAWNAAVYRRLGAVLAA